MDMATRQNLTEGGKIALGASLAVFTGQFFQIPFSYWLLLGVYMVYIPPNQGMMLKRAKLGFLGTLLGLAAAFLYYHLFLHQHIFYAYFLPLFVVILVYFSRDKMYLTFAGALLVLVCLYGVLDPSNAGPSQVLLNRLVSISIGITICILLEFFFKGGMSVSQTMHEGISNTLTATAQILPNIIERYDQREPLNEEHFCDLSNILKHFDETKEQLESLSNEIRFDLSLLPVYQTLFKHLSFITARCSKMANIANHPFDSTRITPVVRSVLDDIVLRCQKGMQITARFESTHVNIDDLLAQLPQTPDSLNYLTEELVGIVEHINHLNDDCQIIQRSTQYVKAIA